MSSLSGEFKTPANWMRNFIVSHDAYEKDSRVKEPIMYDLAVTCDKISQELIGCPELFGSPKTKSSDVTLPRCAKVKEEVDRITEKILTKKVLSDEDEKSGILDDRFGKPIGVGVLSDGSGNVQM